MTRGQLEQLAQLVREAALEILAIQGQLVRMAQLEKQVQRVREAAPETMDQPVLMAQLEKPVQPAIADPQETRETLEQLAQPAR